MVLQPEVGQGTPMARLKQIAIRSKENGKFLAVHLMQPFYLYPSLQRLSS